ncbi:MAG: hypothetical protein ACTSVC_05460 [Promethearchaeota archaeon]
MQFNKKNKKIFLVFLVLFVVLSIGEIKYNTKSISKMDENNSNGYISHKQNIKDSDYPSYPINQIDKEINTGSVTGTYENIGFSDSTSPKVTQKMNLQFPSSYNTDTGDAGVNNCSGTCGLTTVLYTKDYKTIRARASNIAGNGLINLNFIYNSPYILNGQEEKINYILIKYDITAFVTTFGADKHGKDLSFIIELNSGMKKQIIIQKDFLLTYYKEDSIEISGKYNSDLLNNITNNYKDYISKITIQYTYKSGLANYWLDVDKLRVEYYYDSEIEIDFSYLLHLPETIKTATSISLTIPYKSANAFKIKASSTEWDVSAGSGLKEISMNHDLIGRAYDESKKCIKLKFYYWYHNGPSSFHKPYEITISNRPILRVNDESPPIIQSVTIGGDQIHNNNYLNHGGDIDIWASDLQLATASLNICQPPLYAKTYDNLQLVGDSQFRLSDPTWFTNLNEGNFSLGINVTDSAGNKVIKIYNLVKDTIAPEIANPGTIVSNATAPDVYITATDEGGIQGVYIGDNPLIPLTYIGNDTYHISKDNSDWKNLWNGLPPDTYYPTHIYAIDMAGNIKNVDVNLYKALTPPKLEIIYPSNGSIFEWAPDIVMDISSPINITNITITLNGSNFDNVIFDSYLGMYVFNSSSPDFSQYSNIWNNLTLGQHTISVLVQDQAGNINRSVIEVQKGDINPPLINITCPRPYERFSAPPDIIAEVFDSHLNQTYCILNGDMFPINNSIPFSIWDYIPDGPFTVFVYADDIFGHISVANITLVKDTLPPIISTNLSSTLEHDYYFNYLPEVTIFLEENCSMNITVRHNLDLTNYTNINNNLVITFPHQYFYNGSLIDITIFAVDTAGNTISHAFSIYIDTEPPNITILNKNGTYNEFNFTLEYTSNENVSVFMWSDGFFVPYTPLLYAILPYGSHELKLKFEDRAGNAVYRELNIKKIDTIRPVISVISPANNSEIGITPPYITFTVFDKTNVSIYIIFDGEKYFIGYGNYNYTRIDYQLMAWEDFSGKTGVVYITVVDDYNNTQTISIVLNASLQKQRQGLDLSLLLSLDRNTLIFLAMVTMASAIITSIARKRSIIREEVAVR